MAHVITRRASGAKETSCVEVCPVDCIHPTSDEPDFNQHEQLYVDPDERIDCDACLEACPVDAITSEDLVPPEMAVLHRDQRRLLPGRSSNMTLDFGSGSRPLRVLAIISSAHGLHLLAVNGNRASPRHAGRVRRVAAPARWRPAWVCSRAIVPAFSVPATA